MQIKDLHPNPDNPRSITSEKLAQLKKAVDTFGDLGGFVFNKQTKRLVGGHQRSQIFDQDADIVIEQKYKKPTRTGTVAEGYVVLAGEKFKYREVSWPEATEKAANIAANRGAGDWDYDKLGKLFNDLNLDGFDLDLTMFDQFERTGFMDDKKPKDSKNVEFTVDDFSDLKHRCPKCRFEFND